MIENLANFFDVGCFVAILALLWDVNKSIRNLANLAKDNAAKIEKIEHEFKSCPNHKQEWIE